MTRLAIIFILNMFVISLIPVQGQTFCETESPEQDRLEQIGMTGYAQTLDQVIIRIWLHIIRDSNGNGGLTWDQATNAITIIASDYEEGGIYFFMDGSDEIHDDYYYFTGSKFNELIQVNAHSDAIDIYLLPTNVWNAGRASGIPGLALVLGGTLFSTQLAGSSVLSHEMGHCLALYHTHHGIELGGCMEEIDGSNCLQCGDFVCDTPADPGIWFQVDASCNYTGGAVDPNGIPYEPDTHNIMSYSKPKCLDYLSDG